MNQGMSARQAMLKAGYSEYVANNPGSRLLRSNAIINMVDQMKNELHRHDITAAYLATKFKQWLEATKTAPILGEIPDYQTQIAAYDRLKDIYGIKPEPNKELKRRITLEEFINQDPNTPLQDPQA